MGFREPELRIGYQLIINDPREAREANWLSIDNQFVPPWKRRKLGSSEEIRDQFQQICLTKQGSIEAALAKYIFRITQWNLLKPKKSKIIGIFLDFCMKKNEESAEMFECFKLKLLKSTLFRKSFGRRILRIECIKLAQTCCSSVSKLFASLLFG